MWKVTVENKRTGQRVTYLKLIAQDAIEARRKAMLGKEIKDWKVIFTRQVQWG